MPKAAKPLTALSIRRAKPGYVADGNGLYLQVTGSGARSWIYRYSLHGRRREMGLGAFPTISIATARNLAAGARSLVLGGDDPIEAREAERARKRLEGARSITFTQAAEQFLQSHEGTWKNSKHRQQWRNTLATYAHPVIGSLPVADVHTEEVIRLLDPIWKAKADTASRVRARVERVLDWAKVRGYRSGENPARWRGHLDKLFPARRKVRKVKHHAAVPIDEMPSVYARLSQSPRMAAMALRFAILTGARAGEVTGATWAELDLDTAMWSIPASRMKAQREHRVPLSREAVGILREMKKVRATELVFPGYRAGTKMSVSSLLSALKAAGGGDATVHGFRSTLRDWAAERTTISREVAEMALAHTIGDKVEAAYRRGDLMAKRSAMMQQWATFIRTIPTENVVPIGRQRASDSPGR
jgi:integrase